jgi:tRNA(Ile2) C34 agmatinyltransferase TiaS
MLDKTRCPTCSKRLIPVLSNGRTDLRCLECEKIDPLKTNAVKWAKSPLATPAGVADSN